MKLVDFATRKHPHSCQRVSKGPDIDTSIYLTAAVDDSRHPQDQRTGRLLVERSKRPRWIKVSDLRSYYVFILANSNPEGTPRLPLESERSLQQWLRNRWEPPDPVTIFFLLQ